MSLFCAVALDLCRSFALSSRQYSVALLKLFPICRSSVTSLFRSVALSILTHMKVHPSKTKELIVSRPRSKPKIDPLRPFIDGAERVSTLKVLGVVLDSRLKMSEHVSRVLGACASSTFALRLLKTHGLHVGSD